MIPYLIPKKSVGIFEFNTKIDCYFDKINLIKEEDEDVTGWECYRLDELGLYVYTENQVIISISCYEECIMSGNNIIGMYIEQFKYLYNVKEVGDIDEFYMEDCIQLVYEFESIGLQIWTKDDIIVTVIASEG